MSTTLCIVNPGRAVRHDRKRHTEGALLNLDAIDVEFLVACGDVSIYTPPEPGTGQMGDQPADLTADQVTQALDTAVAAIAKQAEQSEAQPAPQPAAQPEASKPVAAKTPAKKKP